MSVGNENANRRDNNIVQSNLCPTTLCKATFEGYLRSGACLRTGFTYMSLILCERSGKRGECLLPEGSTEDAQRTTGLHTVLLSLMAMNEAQKATGCPRRTCTHRVRSPQCRCWHQEKQPMDRGQHSRICLIYFDNIWRWILRLRERNELANMRYQLKSQLEPRVSDSWSSLENWSAKNASPFSLLFQFTVLSTWANKLREGRNPVLKSYYQYIKRSLKNRIKRDSSHNLSKFIDDKTGN